MPTYDASQIVGKTLTARRRVPFFYKYVDGRENKPDGYFKAGNVVGTVQTWLNPNPPTRNKLYWAFVDAKGVSYYIPHERGSFDVKGLQQQGAQTELELLQDANKKPQTFVDVALKVGLTAVAAWALVTFASNAMGGKNKGRVIYLK